MIKYAPIVDEALSLVTKIDDAANLPRLVYNRHDKYADSSLKDRPEYVDYLSVMESQDWPIAECESLPSTHTLYILYTSGTTG